MSVTARRCDVRRRSPWRRLVLATRADAPGRDKTTLWTDARLARLYERYRRLYWRGRLPEFTVRVAELTRCVGLCEWTTRVVTVDVAQHDSDREVRSTLLHEMCHVAAVRGGTAHGSRFMRQLERLLRLGAPVTLDLPETGNAPTLSAVPARFRRCRGVLRAAYARERREVERQIAERCADSQPIEGAQLRGLILDGFEDAGMQRVPWRAALWGIGREFHLIDIDGEPLSWARDLVRAGMTAWRRGRRAALEYDRAAAVFGVGSLCEAGSRRPVGDSPPPVQVSGT